MKDFQTILLKHGYKKCIEECENNEEQLLTFIDYLMRRLDTVELVVECTMSKKERKEHKKTTIELTDYFNSAYDYYSEIFKDKESALEKLDILILKHCF